MFSSKNGKLPLKAEINKPVTYLHYKDELPSAHMSYPSPTGMHKRFTTEPSNDELNISEDILNEIVDFSQVFPNLATEISALTSKSSLVYLLGTNHTNPQCQNDVANVIKHVKPNVVVVELCPNRACNCSKHYGNIFQTMPEFSFPFLRKVVKQIGFIPAFIFLSDVFRENYISNKNVLLDYGGELITAMIEAKQIPNCEIILGDRPIDVTLKRQATLLSKWRKIRLVSQVVLGLTIKRWMAPLLLNASSLVFNDKRTYDILVFERDLFLTYSIQVASSQENSTRIVAVVGQGHMPGIQKYWGKVSPSVIPFILAPTIT